DLPGDQLPGARVCRAAPGVVLGWILRVGCTRWPGHPRGDRGAQLLDQCAAGAASVGTGLRVRSRWLELKTGPSRRGAGSGVGGRMYVWSCRVDSAAGVLLAPGSPGVALAAVMAPIKTRPLDTIQRRRYRDRHRAAPCTSIPDDRSLVSSDLRQVR